jgi:hypothetical protein
VAGEGGVGGGAASGGAGGSKPTSCAQGEWLCHGVCVPIGSCQARELSLGSPIASENKSEYVNDIMSDYGYIYDVNGDGHMDAIYSTYSYGTVKNSGYGIFAAYGSSNCTFNNENAFAFIKDESAQALGFQIIAFKDLNGDGTPDILGKKTSIVDIHYSTTEIVIIYLKNGGNFQVETFSTESLGMGQYNMVSPITVGDVDADGGLDILVQFIPKNMINVYGPISMIRRDKEGKFIELTAPWGPNVSETAYGNSFLQDLDGDHRAELLVFSSNLKNLALSWQSPIWSPTQNTNFKPSTPVNQGSWKDIDFDGKADFLGYDEVWRNKGGGTFEKSTLGPWPTSSKYDMLDVDLDGNLDLPGCDGWHRGDGFGNYDPKPGKVITPITYPSFCSAAWVDVTGDGLPDGIGGGTTIVCYPNIGKPILK